jgi:hypothetical protein
MKFSQASLLLLASFTGSAFASDVADSETLLNLLNQGGKIAFRKGVEIKNPHWNANEREKNERTQTKSYASGAVTCEITYFTARSHDGGPTSFNYSEPVSGIRIDAGYTFQVRPPFGFDPGARANKVAFANLDSLRERADGKGYAADPQAVVHKLSCENEANPDYAITVGDLRAATGGLLEVTQLGMDAEEPAKMGPPIAAESGSEIFQDESRSFPRKGSREFHVHYRAFADEIRVVVKKKNFWGQSKTKTYPAKIRHEKGEKRFGHEYDELREIFRKELKDIGYSSIEADETFDRYNDMADLHRAQYLTDLTSIYSGVRPAVKAARYELK